MQHHITGTHVVSRLHPSQMGRDGRMIDHYSLWPSGRTRGEDYVGNMAWPKWAPSIGIDDRTIGELRQVNPVDRDDGDGCRQPLCMRVITPREDKMRRGHLCDMCIAGFRRRRIDGKVSAACDNHRVHTHQHVHRPHHRNRHDGLGPNTQFDQLSSQPIDAACEFSVPPRSTVAADHHLV